MLAVGAAGAIFLLLMAHRLRRWWPITALVASLVGVAGSAAYAVDTASQAHTGSTPSAGPAGSPQQGSAVATGRRTCPRAAPTAQLPRHGRPRPATARRRLGGAHQTSTAVVTLLEATTTRWAAATIGSMSAAPWQLASGKAVMAIGGFNGRDNAPTLAQFEAWVAEGKISYFISGGAGARRPGGNGGSGSADHHLGRGALHREDRRWHDDLRPAQRNLLSRGAVRSVSVL